MNCFSRFLDNVNTIAREVERSTRRRKRIRREHIVGAFNLATVVVNGVAAAVPQARPVALVLNGLNETVGKKELRDASHSESDS